MAANRGIFSYSARPRRTCCGNRVSDGHKADLVLEISPTGLWAVEIKKSAVPTLSKGFYRACEELPAGRRIAVYRGNPSFEVSPGVEAMSLETLMGH